MFEQLFYTTLMVTIALLGVLLARHETTGSQKGEIKALERENMELRQKLKKEAEEFADLYKSLRAHHENSAEWKEKDVEEMKRSHDEWEKELLKMLEESEKESRRRWVGVPLKKPPIL